VAPDRGAFQDLRARVEAYAFDHPGDVLTFAERLRREYRWSARLAERALREYRRFAFLAAVSGHRVTPSPIVDKVWHFHLTDTRRYWEEFCPHILGRPFHHDPSRGSAAEAREHAAQYRATLRSYVRFFGEAAPEDLWPRTGRPWLGRLGRAGAAVGALWRRQAAPARAATAGLLVALLAGCAAVLDSSSPGAIQGPDFIKLYIGLIAVGVTVMLLVQGTMLTPRGRPGTAVSDLSSNEMAYLAGGGARVLEVGLFRLHQAGTIQLDAAKQTVTLVGRLPARATPVETAIGAAAADGTRIKGVGIIKEPLQRLRTALEEKHLAPDGGDRGGAWIAALVVMGLVIGLGLVRMSYGMSNHRPVGALVMLMIVAAVVTVVVTAIRTRAANKYGKALVRAAREELPNRQKLDTGDPMLFTGVALYGAAILGVGAFTDFTAFASQLRASGGGDGGDSGGGGCGGGGGSCGG
jgi:uncharacterized protein (TIGR04222 family)